MTINGSTSRGNRFKQPVSVPASKMMTLNIDQSASPDKAGSLRQQLGCWLNERWKTELVLRTPTVAKAFGWDWKDLCNRHEHISMDDVTGGRICHWQDSSPLTVARFFPKVGARLLHSVLKEWPIRFEAQPNASSPTPEVSFVLGVRGTGRLPQFQATVDSLLAQTDCETEVIVVEQSWQQQFARLIPKGARYVYTQSTCEEMPYNRSWALNVGVQHAKGKFLALVDADMALPASFAKSCCAILDSGADFLRPARLLFYLNEETSRKFQKARSASVIEHVGTVTQNLPNPMVIRRDRYFSIGGHDEGFFGWGGEDVEFLDRVRQLKCCDGAFLPIVHLWHAEAPQRASGDRNQSTLDAKMEVPASERTKATKSLPFGQPQPNVAWEPIQTTT